MKKGNKVEYVDQIRDLLKLDNLNVSYFLSLYSQIKFPGHDELPIHIYDSNNPSSNGRDRVLTVYPTAIAPENMMSEFHSIQYSDIMDIDKKYAKKAILWIKKMQAGTGSSMVRNKYLSNIYDICEKDIAIGAKGTDLFIELDDKKRVSLAEIQVLQSISDAKKHLYSQIILHDIVSTETENSIVDMWSKKTPFDSNVTYQEFIEKNDCISRFTQSKQYHIPTLTTEGEISFNRTAPGGHGLFAVEALIAAYKEEWRPKNDGMTLISSIGNGEDLGSSPDSAMVSWMVKEEIPLVMITTTKTNIDLKGGQIALAFNKSNKPYITMVEKAQAEASHQVDYFKQLGLRENDQMAYFNTNVILLNYNVLVPKISKLVNEVGEEEFLRIIAPDVIKNRKRQLDPDGMQRDYIQLEGAMGSVVLNLDKFWRVKYGEGLVHILNVDKHNRTKFFSPIKTGFDFFMQLYSDRFDLDYDSYRLINKVPGKLPYVKLDNAYYKEVKNTLDAFKGCHIAKLDYLKVKGAVSITGMTLEGTIRINNHINDLVHLPSRLKQDILKNVEINIYHEKIEIKPIEIGEAP